jgi:hypothetical protein
LTSIRAIVLPLAALVSAGCGELTVPDYNNPSIESLQGNPTPTTIAQAAQGLLIGSRSYMGAQNGFVSLLGIVGRESYNFDPADPRFVTEMLIGPLDPGSPAFGANLYAFFYRNIRLGNTLLAALDQVVGLSDAQKEAVRGFTKTMQAHDFLMLINTRDDLGLPIDVAIDPTGPPAPIVAKAQVFARIVQLLDEGRTHLQAGGGSFPFAVSEGFDAFDTPATFIEFNRAMKARVDAYMGNYSAANTSLAGSFLDTSEPLTLGAYHVFSTESGDLDNQLFDPNGRAILAHPSILTDAQLRANGERDLRATSKVRTLDEPRTVQDVTTNLLFTIYNSSDAPVPIIRNEELILLRAEARYNTGDPVGALADINFIRQNSGGLAPRGPFADANDFITELLYNRRYSLMFEGGHRWIDARRFNRLGTLPRALPSHTVPTRFPYPEGECLARDPEPAQGC